jgi:cytoplasmic tRNA 2-thiolation protein 1
MKKCNYCKTEKPSLKRPKTGKLSCVKCFIKYFEEEIHETIMAYNFFTKGEIVAIGISGGKDSTVLAHVINKLNNTKNYDINIKLIAIDEGIKGYRDGSIETIEHNAKLLNLPLLILSFKDLFGLTMDEIVPKCGLSNSCTYCGVFRRQALDKGAEMVKATKLITGHNADDIAETVLMNFLRGDFNRLPGSVDPLGGGDIPRVKPFKYTYEKEIVMYAHYCKLEYFCSECTYAVGAYRGNVRSLIKDLELERPQSLIDIIHSGELFKIEENVKQRDCLKCIICGHVCSNKKCKACLLLENLNKENNINKPSGKEIKYQEMKEDE